MENIYNKTSKAEVSIEYREHHPEGTLRAAYEILRRKLQDAEGETSRQRSSLATALE